MKKPILLIMLVMGLLASYKTVFPQDQKYQNELHKNHTQKWQEDIEYLVRHLEILHPNLYANISKASFYSHTEQLKRKIQKSTDVQMIFGIQELIARIRNTHTLCDVLRYMNFSEELKTKFHYYPIFYGLFDDGLCIIGVPEKYKSILGKKVIKIGNFTTEKTIDDLSRFVAADNSITPKANIPRFF